MNQKSLLVPLRIPELGPSLGKVVTGTGADLRGVSLQAVRNRLATRILTGAGEARRLAARGERSAAVAGVGRSVWLEAWEEAVAQVARLVAQRISDRLVAEAGAVGMSRRRQRQLVLGPDEERALAARLGSAGAPLVPALDELEHRSPAVLTATPQERAAIAAWQEALRTAARRLEAAWLAMEQAIRLELEQREQVADEIAAWRKPLWPVAVLGAVLIVAAVWLGLILGGYTAAPAWLARVWEVAGGR